MKKIIDHAITISSAAVMIFFAIPKLLGKAQSRAGFQEFEHALSIDADLFRVFTGVSELVIAAILIVFLITKNRLYGKIAFSFLLVTMVSALGLEFFAREQMKLMLVVIALILASFSIYRLKTIR